MIAFINDTRNRVRTVYRIANGKSMPAHGIVAAQRLEFILVSKAADQERQRRVCMELLQEAGGVHHRK